MDSIENLIAKTPVEQRDPSRLKLAASNKHIVRLKRGTPRYNALVRDIDEEGIIDPLLIDKDGNVYEGWTRREIAIDLQLKNVPVKVCVTAENARQIIWRYTIARKNPTLGQMAYCLVPDLEEAFEEARNRRANNASKSNPKNLDSFSNVDEMAAHYGINYEYLRQARNIHQFWKDHPEPKKWGDEKRAITLRDKFEPQILDMDKPLSLGNAIKAIGFLVAYDANEDKGQGGKPKGNVQKQMDLFGEVVEDGISRWDYYAKWSDKVKEKHWQDVRVIVDSLPLEKVEGLRDYYKKMAAEYERRVRDAKKEGK